MEGGADVFGHSLGGALGQESNAHGRVVTSNKGAGLGDIGKTIGKNQTDYRNAFDVVSLLSTTQNHKGKFYNRFSWKPLDLVGNHKIIA